MALVDNLEGYWSMDEVSGTRADSTANGNDLTDNNTVGSLTGIISNGADFELANAEYLNRTNANLSTGMKTDRTDWSIQVWLNPESLAVDGDFFTKWTGAPNRGYIFRLTTAGSITTFITADGTNFSSGTVVAGITTGSWQHVVITMDGDGSTSTTMEVWVNGVSKGTAAVARSPVKWSVTADFTIADQQGGGQYYDGGMDEVGIWSRLLTDPEIAELYNSGAGLAYPFTAGGGAVQVHSNLALLGVG